MLKCSIGNTELHHFQKNAYIITLIIVFAGNKYPPPFFWLRKLPAIPGMGICILTNTPGYSSSSGPETHTLKK